jgi:hypothetical protein
MPSGSRIVLRTAAEADIPTPDTDQTVLFMDADDSGAPAYKDDGGTVHSMVGTAGADGVLSYLDHGNTGSTETVDASAGDIQRLVANAATVTLTLTGWPSAGTPGIVRLWLEQDASAPRSWVFPGSVDWGEPGAPDWSTRGAGDVDLVDLMSVDGGTTVIAVLGGREGPAGAAGSNGTNGVDGTVGGAISIDYTFSTTTTDSDPGSGNLRLSNATQASAVTIRADLLDSHGTDWTAVLDSLADASNTVKGHIRLFKKSDPTKWLVYTVSAVATPSGYVNITVANVSSSGANPLGNGDAITLAFSRSGDQGSTVGAGTLTTIEEVDGSPTDSAVTKLVFPNGTLGIASHVATYTPATPSAVAGQILALKVYAPASQTILSTTSTTFADVDATNAVVTFTAPASGNVMVRVSAFADTGAGAYFWGLRESTTDQTTATTRVVRSGGQTNYVSVPMYLTGLSAGSHTIKLSHAVTAGVTGRIIVQDGSVATSKWGPLVIEVVAAP